MDIKQFDARHDAQRDEFVRAHPRASFFHLAGWRRAVERTFEHEARDLLAWEGDRIAGVLPLFLCRTPFGAKHLISVPYGVYGGPVGESPAAEKALVDAAIALGRRAGVGRVELRCKEDPGLDLVPSDLYATFIQDLPETSAEVMTRMPKRARAEVRKAIEAHGLVMTQGDWYLDDLYEMFHVSKQSLGSPGLPKSWFRALVSELGDGVVLHLARTREQPVAATMSFLFGDTLSFYYIGTIADGNRRFNATNYLVTRLQEWGVEQGFQRFDLGRSRVDSGPYEFKKHQGFEPTPLCYRYALVKSRKLPSFNPSNPKTEKLREVWSKLPAWATKRLSAPMMRYLP